MQLIPKARCSTVFDLKWNIGKKNKKWERKKFQTQVKAGNVFFFLKLLFSSLNLSNASLLRFLISLLFLFYAQFPYSFLLYYFYFYPSLLCPLSSPSSIFIPFLFLCEVVFITKATRPFRLPIWVCLAVFHFVLRVFRAYFCGCMNSIRIAFLERHFYISIQLRALLHSLKEQSIRCLIRAI